MWTGTLLVSYFFVGATFYCTLWTGVFLFLISALTADQNEEEAARGVQPGRLCGHVYGQRDVGGAWNAIRWRDRPYSYVRAPTAGEAFQQAAGI